MNEWGFIGQDPLVELESPPHLITIKSMWLGAYEKVSAFKSPLIIAKR